MPYIPQADRDPIDDAIEIMPKLQKPGEVNYAISLLCDRYIKQHGRSYHTINDLIGVLECAKLELYRRIAAPYETSKMLQNGDVYTP